MYMYYYARAYVFVVWPVIDSFPFSFYQLSIIKRRGGMGLAGQIKTNVFDTPRHIQTTCKYTCTCISQFKD